MSFRTLNVSPSPCTRSGRRSRWVTASHWRRNWASGSTWTSRGANQGSPRTWATWSLIWARVWLRAAGMAWVVGGPDEVVVPGAMVIVGDVEVVTWAREATWLLPPPSSPARTAAMASPAARRATTRAMATRGAGTRIAGHGTGR